MFTPEDWPSDPPACVHWFPCSTCGDFYFKITADPALPLAATSWAYGYDQCEVCNLAELREEERIAQARAKHPSRQFWQRGA